MTTELEKTLAEEFPFMRRGLSLKEQEEKGRINDLYGALGLDCGSGWFQLVRDICISNFNHTSTSRRRRLKPQFRRDG